MQQFKSKLPWSVDSTLSIYDKEIPIMIMCQWDFDDTEIEGDEEYLKQFNKGNYVNCYIVITIHGVNLTGSDRLFGIHCKSDCLEQDLIQTIIDACDSKEQDSTNTPNNPFGKLNINDLFEKNQKIFTEWMINFWKIS